MQVQIADDQILVSLLRLLLPPYKGEALVLFRGENLGRWKLGKTGLAWTKSEEIAQMFGEGLNAVKSGGVLLKAQVAPEAIISGPNAHSSYLGEDQFTVDPFAIHEISAIATYAKLKVHKEAQHKLCSDCR